VIRLEYQERCAACGYRQAAELEDLAAELEVLCDPVKARRIAFPIDEQEHPDD
jgi:hypothetical protein